MQQLLAAIWYEGLPGFRRKNLVGQLFQVFKLGVMFPVYCIVYMIAPNSKMGLFMKKPFVKFICHSASYVSFLCEFYCKVIKRFVCFAVLLGCASQRVEILLFELFAPESWWEMVKEWKRKERGATPGIAECGVTLYVAGILPKKTVA